MNIQLLRKALTLVTLIVAASGTGYWLGRATPDPSVLQTPVEPAPAARKPLYYRNPMGLPDTSPVPRKDPMGMDYIPVYADKENGASSALGTLSISSEKVQLLGVRTERASMNTLDRQVRAAARIEADERRTYAISSKFEGYVERLHVNTTGQAVHKGQALFEVYSPELLSAQREYAIAAEGVASLQGGGPDVQAGMRQLAESSLARLRNWDISDDQIRALANAGDARRTLTFRSPASGIITEKRALQGMRFMPGDPLYQVSDLSVVWVIADVFEQDISLVRPGRAARVSINAYPGRTFEGTVSFVYPNVNADTRTVPVRIELPNPSGLFKPGMYADVALTVTGEVRVVTVPSSAVIDSGTRRVVFVERAPGRFEPREVQIGARADDRVEVLAGVGDGEPVVVSANFLIDAESNLKAAFGSFGHATHADTDAGAVRTDAQSAADTAVAGHRAEGRLVRINPDGDGATISHGPVDSLRWPAMSMDFRLAHSAVAKDLRAGDAITFEFVERARGEWVVTSMERSGKPVPAPVPAAVPGHGHSEHDAH